MYTKTERIIMWMSSFDFMSYKKAKFLIDNFEDLEGFFDNISNFRNELRKLFDDDEINELIQEKSLSYIDSVIVNYEKLGIKVVTIRSEDYSNLLKESDAPPIMLYCKGDVSLLKSTCLAVVGTRRATKYGKDTCNKFIKDIALEDITIVSGLAEGIDTCAHKACIEVGGKTIAVLGGGILNIYPQSNIKLAEEIIDKGGLIISEYKPNEQSLTYHFPIRNRIIAGLSQAVFVVEATEKSGSMHTKNYAIDYNREVFALPGRVGDIYSVGCNKCIANGQARMVLNSSDIIEFFGKSLENNSDSKAIQLTYEEQIIYDKLLGHEKHFDELIKETGLDAKNLQIYLMRLTLSGVVEKQPGNYYALK
jgi:DNA processing protein